MTRFTRSSLPAGRQALARSAVYDRWAPWILIALTAALPLVFDFSMHDTFDLPKMLLVDLAVVVLFGLWFWQQSAEGWAVRPTGMVIPILVFLAVGLLSCRSSIDLSRSLLGAYRTYVYGWLPMVVLAGLFFLTSQIDSEIVTRRVIMAAILSSALAGLYGILQYTGNEIFDVMPAVANGRVWSSLGNPIYFGAIAMMALPLALSRRHATNMICLLFILPGLALSLSRSAWMGSLVSMGCLLFVFRHKIQMHGSKMAWGAVLVIVLGFLFPPMRNRLSVMISTRESSNAGRIEGWKGGLRVWRHHPILGSGPDTFFEAFRPYRNEAFLKSAGRDVTQAHAHNEIIQVAATLGSLGLAAWIWIVLAYGRRLRLICREDHASMTGDMPFLVASLIAIFIQNLFNPSSAATAGWTAIFAGLAIRHGTRQAFPWRPWPLWTRVGTVGMFLIGGLWAIGIPLRAEHAYKEGIVREAQGREVHAIADYRDAVRLRPDIEAYQMSLGNAARTLAQLSPDGPQRQLFWQEAMKAAQESVRRHPANPDTWNDLGVAEMWLTQSAGAHRLPEALSDFEKAITLDPVFIDAWANKAKWYHIAGDLESEKKIWKVVLQLDPQHAMALQVLGQTPQEARP